MGCNYLFALKVAQALASTWAGWFPLNQVSSSDARQPHSLTLWGFGGARLFNWFNIMKEFHDVKAVLIEDKHGEHFAMTQVGRDDDRGREINRVTYRSHKGLITVKSYCKSESGAIVLSEKYIIRSVDHKVIY